MSRILKYELNHKSGFAITVGAGSRFLHFDFQGGKPFVWIEVSDAEELVRATFYLFFTGDTLPNSNLVHLASTLSDKPLAWHLYAEGISKA